MNADELAASLVAAARRAFDESFAAPPASRVEGTVAVLSIRIGADRFAMRLGELSGLHLRRKIVPLPSAVPGLIGLAGIRDRVVPVFSLARLLGYAEADAERWVALTGNDEPIALAFAEFDGFYSLAPSALHAADAADAREHVKELAQIREVTLPVVSIPFVVRGIRARI